MTRRLWAPLLAVLLVAVIVGPGTVTATEPRVTTRTITIPPAAFQPSLGDRWLNQGYTLDTHPAETLSPAGPAQVFQAALSFEEPAVTIRKITLIAYDSNEPGFIGLRLWRVNPLADDQDLMGEVVSTGTGTLVRSFTLTDLPIRRITGAHGPYLELWIADYSETGLSFKGARITYSY
jgi:hypothetical protein